MRTKANTWHQLIFLFAALFFSAQALADCPDTCAQKRSQCEEASSPDQKFRCEEKFNVCNLSCNREQTQYCVYVGFTNHEGTADKEKELKELTGAFTRVTEDEFPHFAGLCRNLEMRCDYTMAWDKTQFSCGGEKREPNRVACCR